MSLPVKEKTKDNFVLDAENKLFQGAKSGQWFPILLRAQARWLMNSLLNLVTGKLFETFAKTISINLLGIESWFE